MLVKKMVNLSLSDENWESSVRLVLHDDARNIDIDSISIQDGQWILEGQQVSNSEHFDIL